MGLVYMYISFVLGMGSDQVATVLRQSGAQVRLVIARPADESSSSSQSALDNPAIIPTATLEEYLHTLNARLDEIPWLVCPHSLSLYASQYQAADY